MLQSRMFLAALFFAAGPVLAATPPPIVNGAVETGFPTVVSLGADFGSQRVSLCTANIITTRLLLTAAHCTDFIPPSVIAAGGRAFVGPDIWNTDYELRLVEQYVHPDYEPLDNSIGSVGAYDISLILLAEDSPLRPMWLRQEALSTDLISTPMLSIGFGLDERDQSGVKRSATLLLSDIDDQFLLSSSSTNPDRSTICSGDSGGPQIAEVNGQWEQWGIHSWGDSNCRSLSGSQRVDVGMDWILDQVEAVHGTRDLCIANGWANDGTCDEVCETVGAIDPDCVIIPAFADASTAKGTEGCSTQPSPRRAAGWAMLLVFALLIRRRKV